MESGIHGFGIWNPANGTRNPTIIVIQNPDCWLWNPESIDVESRIHRHGIRNPQTWNPESTDMESGIHSMESGIQDSRGLPWGVHLSTTFYSIPLAVF